MESVPPLLRLGNSKLGEGIWCWNLHPVITCPGRTEVCYARRGRFRTLLVRDVLERNLEEALRDDFAERMVRDVRRRGAWVVRIHGAGDFFDPLYTAKWMRVIRRCKRSRFFADTRSWRSPLILPALEEMAELKNCRLWFSVDHQTGVPERLPPRVQLTWLQTGEVPRSERIGVVFRPREGLQDGEGGEPAAKVGQPAVGAGQVDGGVNQHSCGRSSHATQLMRSRHCGQSQPGQDSGGKDRLIRPRVCDKWHLNHRAIGGYHLPLEDGANDAVVTE